MQNGWGGSVEWRSTLLLYQFEKVLIIIKPARQRQHRHLHDTRLIKLTETVNVIHLQRVGGVGPLSDLYRATK